MPDTTGPTIDIAELRLGLFVHLDLGWMDHPFPLGSFKITSQQQIDTIRTLGLNRLRYSPDKSDPEAAVSEPPSRLAVATPAPTPSPEALERARHKALQQTQRLSLQQCERQFGEAARAYRQVIENLEQHPEAAREQGLAMVHGVVEHITGAGDSAIRLLSEGLGDRAALHSVNVMVLSLLLGKALGMSSAELQDLGVAALLHDMGKTALPERVRFREDNFAAAQLKLYQEHVGHSLQLGKQLGLNARVLLAMAQHHEMADGSGFPMGIKADKIAPASCILALINRYDNLCNPGSPASALTPHESLSLIFAQMKDRFDGNTLSAFIRMMGVYPPGSVVQLLDGRYAMVVSVNSTRPLKPRVVVHDSHIPRDEALVLDLEHLPGVGIKRSVKPLQLPRATLDYLSPRTRICYYFERAADNLNGPNA
ncbi:MAG: hypothetical protein RJA09_2263 [Pseudomonadota bacterium]|jgi:HD-GYP domain-containing protein (c-di-GMP phosphodiesterase class II)